MAMMPNANLVRSCWKHSTGLCQLVRTRLLAVYAPVYFTTSANFARLVCANQACSFANVSAMPMLCQAGVMQYNAVHSSASFRHALQAEFYFPGQRCMQTPVAALSECRCAHRRTTMHADSEKTACGQYKNGCGLCSLQAKLHAALLADHAICVDWDVERWSVQRGA